MFIVFPYAFALKLELSEDYQQYFKARFAGYWVEQYDSDLFGAVIYGDNLLEKNHEVIRPPVGLGAGLFLFDTSNNTLSGNFHELFSSQVIIEISSEFSTAFLGNFIEYLYYLHLKRMGKTVIHSSAFELNGEVVLCPAWRNTGKTNLLINALSAGASYIADDWVICDNTGKIEIFPKSVNVESYNVENVCKWSPNCMEAKLLAEMECFIEKSKYFDRAAKAEILSGTQFFIPLELIPISRMVRKQQPVTVDKVYWLNKVERSKPDVNFHHVCANEIQRHISGTRRLEHYPFELLMDVNPDIKMQEIFGTNKTENIGLGKMLGEGKQLVRVDLGSQDLTASVLEHIQTN